LLLSCEVARFRQGVGFFVGYGFTPRGKWVSSSKKPGKIMGDTPFWAPTLVDPFYFSLYKQCKKNSQKRQLRSSASDPSFEIPSLSIVTQEHLQQAARLYFDRLFEGNKASFFQTPCLIPPPFYQYILRLRLSPPDPHCYFSVSCVRGGLRTGTTVAPFP